jgi:glycosyltransferase involved in cell wall biosynthesis
MKRMLAAQHQTGKPDLSIARPESLGGPAPNGSSVSGGWSLSLCICTMNRPKELEECLDSVFANTNLPDEVIVSDDSRDSQPARALASRFPKVAYLRGPRRGLGANRNACVRTATGDYIVFVDDDVKLPSGFFATARRLIEYGDQKTIMSGYELKHLDEIRKVVPHNADFWGLQRVPMGYSCRAVVINAAIFPKRLFREAQFDEILWYGCEEIDMARHAIALGYRIKYCESLYANHFPSRINRDECRKCVEASRLYATTKAYWKYEGSPLKALVYLVVAPLQLAGSAARHRDVPGIGRAIYSTFLALQYLLRAMIG